MILNLKYDRIITPLCYSVLQSATGIIITLMFLQQLTLAFADVRTTNLYSSSVLQEITVKSQTKLHCISG